MKCIKKKDGMIVLDGENDLVLIKREGSRLTIDGFGTQEFEIINHKGIFINKLTDEEKLKLTDKVLRMIWGNNSTKCEDKYLKYKKILIRR